MPLHPQAAALLAELPTAPPFDYETLDAEHFRAMFRVPEPSGPLAAVAAIADRSIPGPLGPLPVRVYQPSGVGPFPVTLYFHGAGFVVGTPKITDGICRSLARCGGTVVVSVDYRLAPEAPFPCALDDAIAALGWVRTQAHAINGVASELAVAGDSSGGNLAAALAHAARDAGITLRHQLLLYPVLDCRFDTGSYQSYREGYFLTEAMMRWYWRQYLAGGASPDDARVSPLRRRDLSGLASATILTAEYDVLRDEAETYASRLRDASVPVELQRWEGQFHGFLLLEGVLDDASTALRGAGDALRRAFAAAAKG